MATTRSCTRPSYRELAGLPLAARAEQVRDPEVRACILGEADVAPTDAGSMEMFAMVMQVAAEGLFGLDEVVDYEQQADQAFGAVAARLGITPLEAVYDFLAAGDGGGIVALAGHGLHRRGTSTRCARWLLHPTTIVGLADAGAHVKLICDGSSPSTQLTLWTRDRTRGDLLPLEFMVEQQAQHTARLYGFDDRGTIEVGRPRRPQRDRPRQPHRPPSRHAR